MRSNPFRHPQRDEALKAVMIITENASKANQQRQNWNESIIPEHDPENIYTPLNIVAHSLDPRIRDTLLAVLLDSRHQTYEEIIDDLEHATPQVYDITQGEIPEEWTTPGPERVKRGKKTRAPSPLKRRWIEWEVGEDDGISYEEMVSDLHQPLKKKRRRFRG